MRLARWAGLLCLAACGSGTPFGGSKACTEIGCLDQLTVILASGSGALPSGMQTLTVTADGVTQACSFTLPLAVNGGVVPCPGLQVRIHQDTSCTTTSDAGSQTMSCTPIAGQLSEELTILGAPSTVHVTQTSAGATVADGTLMPVYVKTQPNGPGCDPICSQGSGSLVLGPM